MKCNPTYQGKQYDTLEEISEIILKNGTSNEPPEFSNKIEKVEENIIDKLKLNEERNLKLNEIFTFNIKFIPIENITDIVTPILQTKGKNKGKQLGEKVTTKEELIQIQDDIRSRFELLEKFLKCLKLNSI